MRTVSAFTRSGDFWSNRPSKSSMGTRSMEPDPRLIKRMSTTSSEISAPLSSRKRPRTTSIRRRPKTSKYSFEQNSRSYKKRARKIKRDWEKLQAKRKEEEERMDEIQQLYKEKRKKKRYQIKEENENDSFAKKATFEDTTDENDPNLTTEERTRLKTHNLQKRFATHMDLPTKGWDKVKSHHEDPMEDPDYAYAFWESTRIQLFRDMQDDNERITQDQLEQSLRRVYSRMPDDEIHQLLQQRDNAFEDVDLMEFLFIHRIKEEEIEQLFNSIDVDGDKKIFAEELQLYLNTQPDLYELEATDIIFENTNNMKGSLSLSEFKLLFGMGPVEAYREFDQRHDLHVEVCKFFYGMEQNGGLSKMGENPTGLDTISRSLTKNSKRLYRVKPGKHLKSERELSYHSARPSTRARTEFLKNDNHLVKHMKRVNVAKSFVSSFFPSGRPITVRPEDVFGKRPSTTRGRRRPRTAGSARKSKRKTSRSMSARRGSPSSMF
mmetsp:Transcript_10554/g.15430  ORF Transcript_10554/g.15430 Transcript_10554/m.15430 type:complete len:493 (+) Transcript_10554:23-1501(+)